MSKPPIHVIRFGLIKVCIWKNHTSIGDRHSVTAVRLYKNGDVWKESSRFGRDDLLVVAKACDQAHTWIMEQNGHDSSQRGTPNRQASEST